MFRISLPKIKNHCYQATPAHKLSWRLCLLLPLATLACFSFISAPVNACTGLMITDGQRVLVGNNEDHANARPKIWFVQPVKDRYGSVFFGFDNFWPQGGMNQKGLFFDFYALKPREVPGQEEKPRFKGSPIKEIMATCATLDEALAWLDKYSRHFLYKTQMFLVDASGQSAIVEGDRVLRNIGNYQVVTNFRQSQTRPEDINCSRYLIAQDLLSGCREACLPCVRRVMAAVHQEGDHPTQYSNIYDLKARRVYVYYFHNFQEEVVIDLEKGLREKPGVLDLSDLFPPNYAARVFGSRYTALKNKYTHASPDFEISYPSAYDPGDALSPDQVFLAYNRYLKVPVLTVSVIPAEQGLELSQVAAHVLAPQLNQFGAQVSIVSNNPVKLTDGSDAYETKITWRWKGKDKTTSLFLSTIRDGKLICVALHHTADLEYLKPILYSLRFK